MKTKFFIWLGILTLFISAAPAQAFEISPNKFLFTVSQGSSQTVPIKITNPINSTNQSKTTFKLDIFGMKQDEAGRPVFSRGVDIAEGWVYPENSLVEIKSGEAKLVNFIIKVPADALPGSYYVGLAIEPVLANKNASTGQAGLYTRLISLLTIEVKGTVQESLAIEKWTPLVSWPNDVEIQNPEFNLSLKNNGNIEFLMRAVVSVQNWKGDEVFSQPIVLGNKLLAGSKRVLQSELAIKDKISFPGVYSANVRINYGFTNQVVSATAYIWYFPLWSRIVLGLVGLLIIFLFFWVAKKIKR